MLAIPKLRDGIARNFRHVIYAGCARIVAMLSCGELYACKLLEAFQITQPTLSRDMRILMEAGIVMYRRKRKTLFTPSVRSVLPHFLILYAKSQYLK